MTIRLAKKITEQAAEWLTKGITEGRPRRLIKWFSSTSSRDLRSGLALPRNKPSLSGDREIKTLSLANNICIPLLNYQQEALTPVVSIGQTVRPGDLLAPGVIASCFGVIESIESRAVNHPSGTN
jgi:Na+-translocating ferredoxin:NAD+ oxidoreductase RnfC subunit